MSCMPNTPMGLSSDASDGSPPARTQVHVQARTPYRRRVRTGCVTCRVRRVKCDETKPQCKRCSSTGRKCDGYEASTVSRNELSRALRRGDPMTAIHFGSNTFSNGDERRIFEFFRLNTAVSGTSNVMGWGFWDQVVLQFVHHEPAIKHGVLALSSLHRSYSGGHDAHGPVDHPFYRDRVAIRHYGLAVQNSSRLFSESQDGPSVEKVLTACIIFVSIENMLANPKGASMHLQNGLRIEREYLARANRSRSGGSGDHSKQSIVSQALGRLDFTAMTMSVPEAPYPHGQNMSSSSQAVVVPASFSSINEAEKYMFAILRDLFAFGTAFGRALDAFEMLAKVSTATIWFTRQMTRWSQSFERLARNLEKLDVFTKNRCMVLRVYQKLAFLIGAAAHASNELAWDPHDDVFTEVLDMIENAPTMNDGHRGAAANTVFSLESGYVIPLFVICVRCRHPEIRRRAIRILRAQRRREVIWESHGAASCAEWLMNLEENGPHGRLPDGRPHDRDRMRIITADVLYDRSALGLKAFLPSDNGTKSLRTVEDVIPICMGLGRKEDCICARGIDTTMALNSPIFKENEYRKLRYEGSMEPEDPSLPTGRLYISNNKYPSLETGQEIDLLDFSDDVRSLRSRSYSSSESVPYELSEKNPQVVVWDDDGFFMLGHEGLHSRREDHPHLTSSGPSPAYSTS